MPILPIIATTIAVTAAATGIARLINVRREEKIIKQMQKDMDDRIAARFKDGEE